MPLRSRIYNVVIQAFPSNKIDPKGLSSFLMAHFKIPILLLIRSQIVRGLGTRHLGYKCVDACIDCLTHYNGQCRCPVIFWHKNQFLSLSQVFIIISTFTWLLPLPSKFGKPFTMSKNISKLSGIPRLTSCVHCAFQRPSDLPSNVTRRAATFSI